MVIAVASLVVGFDEDPELVKKAGLFGVLEQIGRFGKRIRRDKYWEIPDLPGEDGLNFPA